MTTMISWQGIDYNERQVNAAHAMIVGIYLDGVRGVSPDRGHDHKMLSPEQADRNLGRARKIYADLIVQKPVRGAKAWYDHNTKKLGKLLDDATAVREGRMPQKMTEADYAELRRHLKLR